MKMNRTILLISFLIIIKILAAKDQSYNIVFIGNSITHGATHKDWTVTAPPNICAKWLSEQDGIGEVYFANCGRSGRTTYHFLPDSDKVVPSGDPTYFKKVIEATEMLENEHPGLPLLFSFMLGTNDSAERPKNHRTTPEQYVINMTTIIDSLLSRWPNAHVVLNRIIYYTPGFTTKNGSVLNNESLNMIDQYFKKYQEIISKSKKGHVHIGDTLGYDYFREHYSTNLNLEYGKNRKAYYLHPNEKGSEILGKYWGAAIKNILPKLEASDIYISKYYENKDAAISYTFDDGLKEHFTELRDQLKKHGFVATFGVIGSKIGYNHKGSPTMDWNQLRILQSDGHEISNHGLEHCNVTTLTPKKLLHEIRANDSIIYDSLGIWPKTFIYPGNKYSKEAITLCETGKIGSRIHTKNLGGKNTEYGLRQWVNNLIKKNGYAITMTHGISHGYDHFENPEILWRHFDYVDSLRKNIWVGTMSDVIAYIKERQAIKLIIHKKAGVTTITPLIELDKNIFKFPLTMVYRSDNTIEVRQGGKKLPVKEDSNCKLINFNPFGGDLEIREYSEPAWDNTQKKTWDNRFKKIETYSGQKAYIYKSSRRNMPLIVSLHTWSGNYAQNDPISNEVIAKDWNYIHPDFRGANNKFDAMGSSSVIQDIDEAIRWSIEEMQANPEEVHIVGVSGGGFATLATFMNGSYPAKSFSAWAPISDIEAWYWESCGRNQKYANDIRKAIPAGNHIDISEAKKRSPLHQKYPGNLRKNTKLYIYEGVHDGYKGSVPITHSLNMFNRIVAERKYGTNDTKKIQKKAEKDSILFSPGEMIDIVVKRTNPNAKEDEKILGRKILINRESNDVSITIFEGAHEQLKGALSLIPVTE